MQSVGKAREVALSRGRASTGVVRSIQGFYETCLRIFAERRAGSERDGVRQGVGSSAGVPQRIQAQPSELEGREARARVTAVVAAQRVEGGGGFARAAGETRIVGRLEQLARPQGGRRRSPRAVRRRGGG